MHNNVKIEAKSLERGIQMYQIGITKFLGNGLLKMLESLDFSDINELRQKIRPHSEEGTGEWIDMAGLIVPKQKVLDLVDQIEKSRINTFDELNQVFEDWHLQYYQWVWNWSARMFQSELNMDLNQIDQSTLLNFIEEWKKAVISLDEMMFNDARKEFTLKAQTGFGMDGEDEIRNVDFEQVRGAFEQHPAVCDILAHIDKKKDLAKRMTEKIEKLKN
jgi:hypothetical protein